VTTVLIYHDIAGIDERETTGFTGPLAARYKLDPTHFAEHLDAIAASGVKIGLLDDDGGGRPQSALTFDDGGASALAAAAALEKRGWRGHFFITTDRIGTPGFLDSDGVREIAARGHMVGSHSHSHPRGMSRLPGTEIAREWQESRAVLADLLGTPPSSAAVPGGSLSETVIEEAAAAGYRLLMTSEPTSRPRRHLDLTVVGRYTIWATTPAARAAGYASGAPSACGRLWLEWHVKAIPKRLTPGLYQSMRRVRARRP